MGGMVIRDPALTQQATKNIKTTRLTKVNYL